MNDNCVFHPDFTDFLSELTSRDVRFVLVGGYAVGWHGLSRATGDLDVLYEQNINNVRLLCEAIRAFGAPHALADEAVLMTPEMIVQIGVQPVRIDLISSISGVSCGDAFHNASIAVIDGLPLRFLGFEDLLATKRATGRPIDQFDVLGQRLDVRTESDHSFVAIRHRSPSEVCVSCELPHAAAHSGSALPQRSPLRAAERRHGYPPKWRSRLRCDRRPTPRPRSRP